MKKILFALILAAFLITCSLGAFAGPRRHHDGPPGFQGQYSREREDARFVIRRTSMVLLEAQRAVIHSHRSMGLAMAIAAQTRARELFFDRRYREAIFHSLRARDLAFNIIRNNRRRIKPEFFHDAMERRYKRQSPGHEVLDREHHKDGSDDDAAHITIEFDIN